MKYILILAITLLSFYYGYSQDTIPTKKVYLMTVLRSAKTGDVVKVISHKKHVKCGYIVHVKGDIYIVDGKEMKLYARR